MYSPGMILFMLLEIDPYLLSWSSSRSQFITPRETNAYYSYFERQTFIMLHEADPYLSRKVDPYYALQGEYMPLALQGVSALLSDVMRPFLLEEMVHVSFTYTLLMCLCRIQDVEDPHLFSRSWFPSQKASCGPDSLLKKQRCPSRSWFLLEVPAPTRAVS